MNYFSQQYNRVNDNSIISTTNLITSIILRAYNLQMTWYPPSDDHGKELS